MGTEVISTIKPLGADGHDAATPCTTQYLSPTNGKGSASLWRNLAQLALLGMGVGALPRVRPSGRYILLAVETGAREVTPLRRMFSEHNTAPAGETGAREVTPLRRMFSEHNTSINNDLCPSRSRRLSPLTSETTPPPPRGSCECRNIKVQATEKKQRQHTRTPLDPQRPLHIPATDPNTPTIQATRPRIFTEYTPYRRKNITCKHLPLTILKTRVYRSFCWSLYLGSEEVQMYFPPVVMWDDRKGMYRIVFGESPKKKDEEPGKQKSEKTKTKKQKPKSDGGKGSKDGNDSNTDGHISSPL